MMAKCKDSKISNAPKKQHLINVFTVFCDNAAPTWPCGYKGENAVLLTEFCSGFCFKAPLCLHLCTNWCAGWVKASYQHLIKTKRQPHITFLKKILVLFFHLLIKASYSNFTLTKKIAVKYLDHDSCLIMKTLAQHRRQQHWLEKHDCTELPSIMCWMAGYTNTVNQCMQLPQML